MKTRSFHRIIGLAAILCWLSLPEILHGQVIRQGPPVPQGFCVDSAARDLYGMITAFRKQSGLAPIPLSRSLSYVAHLHVKDLYLHHPDRGGCNAHSWSDRGHWKPFCYPADENKKNTVWDKPRELTRYPARGYELVYWENYPLVPDTIMMIWASEPYFLDFLLNSGKWKGVTWNAIGVAVFENYACAWFGEAADPEAAPPECGAMPLPPRSTPAFVDTSIRQADTLQKSYYIIVRTNLSAEAAEKYAVSLRAAGYPAAKVLSTGGKVRVSAFDSRDRNEATARLKEIRKAYRDAWLLVP